MFSIISFLFKRKNINRVVFTRIVMTEKEGFYIEIGKPEYSVLWYHPKNCKEKVFKVRHLKLEDIKRVTSLNHIVESDMYCNHTFIVLTGEYKDKLILRSDCLVI